MVEFRELVISSILIGIFVFAIISFGSQLAVDNSLNLSVLDNEAINNSFGNLETSLDEIKSDSDTQKDSWYDDVPVITELTLIWKSTTGMFRIFFDSLVGLYNVYIEVLTKTIGIPALIANSFTAIIAISVLLLLWRVIRAGS